jgi:23S rRNA pseudouridine2605 synthase
MAKQSGRKETGKGGDYSKFIKKGKTGGKKTFRGKKIKEAGPVKKKSSFKAPRSKTAELIRLNKFIANAGVCSRREADDLIAAGVIKVNDEIVTELGTKVSRRDKVQYGDQTLSFERNRYVLLNKPKGYITTMDDPFSRKTVMELVGNACKERIYPVGRLDRNTTGLLLLTNDGDLAKKLTHPKHGVRKIYHVILDKKLTKEDMQKIEQGIELEDGFIRVDKIGYDKISNKKNEVGIELHSGKNRIVRRIFESLGYKVVGLDRTMFASLTKKNIPRGRWRHLDDREVGMLKMV